MLAATADTLSPPFPTPSPATEFLVQATSIDDYEDLHAFPVRTPDSVHDWEDDDAFARLRLQGKLPYRSR